MKLKLNLLLCEFHIEFKSEISNLSYHKKTKHTLYY